MGTPAPGGRDVVAYTPFYAPGYRLMSLSASYPLRLRNHRTIFFQLNLNNVLNHAEPWHQNSTRRPPGGDLSSPARVSTPNEFSWVPQRSFRFTTMLKF